MSFTLATNVSAVNAANNASVTQKSLERSLERLSSGYKINKAADDASGMAIADSLRSQASSLGQAIRNANDAIGIIQIADKAMDEQVKILDTIKVKAIQAAQDGQTAQTRAALQSDITRLLEELDNISATTTFNGKSLLAGGFSNAKFQIGAYSNTVITASITATSSDKIGQTRFETGKSITQESVTSLTFKAVNGRDDITIESAIISHGVGTGIGALSEIINKNSNELQVRASWSVESTGSAPVGTGTTDTNHTVKDLTINGITIGSINNIKINDSDGNIAASINNSTSQTGVRATIDARGHLLLNSIDGRGIVVTASKGFELLGLEKAGATEHKNYGRLTLTRNNAKDIIIEESTGGTAAKIGFGDDEASEAIINLRTARGSLSHDQAAAIGGHTSDNSLVYAQSSADNGSLSAGVTSFIGAQVVIDVVDTAIINLDKIRSDLGSVQIQLEATVNNVSSTKVNVKFSESQIRDTDYATETSNFKRASILAQAGSYAIAQSSTSQQNIQRLLQ